MPVTFFWAQEHQKQLPIKRFIISCDSSVCGWQLVDISSCIPHNSAYCFQNLEVHSGSLSDNKLSGRPWSQNTLLKNAVATPSAESAALEASWFIRFVMRSTNVVIVSIVLLVMSRCVTNFIAMVLCCREEGCHVRKTAYEAAKELKQLHKSPYLGNLRGLGPVFNNCHSSFLKFNLTNANN